MGVAKEAGGDRSPPAVSSPEGEIRDTTLANGVRIVTERIPGVRSVAVGVWVRHGAAHEAPEVMGASHLLEHLVFKGTRTRSAREIALAVESLGGSLDAFTSREHTSFQARVLDEHFPTGLEILADLVRNPLLRAEDLELERRVVLEEIATVEDTPDDLVFDLHGARFWNGHPYGHRILGTRETVGAMPRETLQEIHGGRYTGTNLLVAAAGNARHEEVVERVTGLFGDLEPGEPAPPLPAPVPREGDEVWIERDTAQTHLVFGMRTPGHSDPRRYGLVLLSAALGGGMSSRLFQRIREELALAYAVYTFQSFYSLAGVGGVYVGTRPEWAARAVEAVRRELLRLAEEGLPPGELEEAKRQVKGQIILSLESTSARLYRLAGFALHDEPYLTLEEVLRRIDEVEVDEARSLAAEFFHPDTAFLLALGPGS